MPAPLTSFYGVGGLPPDRLGLAAYLLVRAAPGLRFRCGRIWFSRLRRSVGWDYVAIFAGKSSPFLIPILAAGLFPPAQVGYMTMAAMIGTVFFAVAASVSYSLLAQCADDPTQLRRQVAPCCSDHRCTVDRPCVDHLPAGFADTRPVRGRLRVLPAPCSSYLLLATIPDALINIVMAILRVQRRLVAVAAVTVTGAISTIGGSWLLMPHLGVNGAGWAVLATSVILAAHAGRNVALPISGQCAHRPQRR